MKQSTSRCCHFTVAGNFQETAEHFCSHSHTADDFYRLSHLPLQPSIDLRQAKYCRTCGIVENRVENVIRDRIKLLSIIVLGELHVER